MYKLSYLRKSESGLCGDDFKRPERSDMINLNLLISLSDLQDFELPFSGKFVGKYAIVTMSNNDCYYINEQSYLDFLKVLRKLDVNTNDL